MAGSIRHSTCVLVFALVLSAAQGCGDGQAGNTTGETRTTSDAPSTAEPPPSVRPAKCPPELENCFTASGTIIFVERRDPDGDGDAHFVLSSEEGITFPGVSVIDVRAELRPHPLPGLGDQISAAGPVYRGSYGQRQIEAIELNLADG